jgi:ABC-2 type transport system permease protein
MNDVFLIAKREYLEQVKSRAFKATTIGLPAVFAVLVLVGYLTTLGLGSRKHLVVAAGDSVLANSIRDRLIAGDDGKTTVDVLAPAKTEDRGRLVEQVRTRELDGLMWVETPAGGLPNATYYSPSSGDFVTGARLTEALNNGLIEEHLVGAGMKQVEVDAVLKGTHVDTFEVKKDGRVVKSNAIASFWKGYVMAFLLSMTTMIYGMNVARSIIQEKTSRIFEVMLAIAKPEAMLAGKLIGVAAVGLTQILIWLLAGTAIFISPFAAALLTGNLAIQFSWAEGILFPVYFLLGYLLYSSLFAGLAATCETEQELQMYMPLAAAPTWLSFAMILLIMNDSNSIWSVLASLFPPTAPIVMFLRMASQTPPLWQIGLSIGLMVVSIWGVLWFSSRLYRVGILMYGKRATLPEILRWARYS